MLAHQSIEAKPLLGASLPVTTSMISTTEENTVLFDRFAYKKKFA